MTGAIPYIMTLGITTLSIAVDKVSHSAYRHSIAIDKVPHSAYRQSIAIDKVPHSAYRHSA